MIHDWVSPYGSIFTVSAATSPTHSAQVMRNVLNISNAMTPTSLLTALYRISQLNVTPDNHVSSWPRAVP
eukprot:2546445-Prorocentrum_lima.AAC.1